MALFGNHYLNYLHSSIWPESALARIELRDRLKGFSGEDIDTSDFARRFSSLFPEAVLSKIRKARDKSLKKGHTAIR